MEAARSHSGVGADGKRGTHFELPLTLGPKKGGRDRHGAAHAVWDFVVHPDTIAMANGSKAVRDMMADTVRAVHGRRRL